MSSLFDPSTFLDVEVTGEMETKRVPFPIGRYNFQITKISVKEGTIEEGDRKGDKWRAFELTCTALAGQKDPLTGETLEKLTGNDTPSSRYSGYLDINSSGALELGPGRNIDLGRIRAATGLNSPTMPFKIKMLQGQVFNGEIYHRPNPKDATSPYAEIRNPLPKQ